MLVGAPVGEPRESEFNSMSPGFEVVSVEVVEVVVTAGVVECVIVVDVLVDVVVVVVSTCLNVVGEKVGAQGIMHASVTRHIQLPLEHSHFRESYV